MESGETKSARPRVFISYSHKDKDMLAPLKAQLKALEKAKVLDVWEDTRIDAGDKWYPEIETAMQNAAVAVCLISEWFLSSDFCIKEEIPFLLERSTEMGMVLIPVLLSDSPWYARGWLKQIQMLPGEGKSVRTDFGDPDPTAGSAWERGERLARLVGEQRALLVLDGLEPLQSANDFDRGRLRDPALQTLLRGLARQAQGLCIVTTREPMSDLDGLSGVEVCDLEQISARAGRALLRTARVVGTDAELEELSRAFGFHAPAISLLGVYLYERDPSHKSRGRLSFRPKGEISQRDFSSPSDPRNDRSPRFDMAF